MPPTKASTATAHVLSGPNSCVLNISIKTEGFIYLLLVFRQHLFNSMQTLCFGWSGRQGIQVSTPDWPPTQCAMSSLNFLTYKIRSFVFVRPFSQQELILSHLFSQFSVYYSFLHELTVPPKQCLMKAGSLTLSG